MRTGLEIINLVEQQIGYPKSATLEGPDVRSETEKLRVLLNHVLSVLQGMNDWTRLKTTGYIQTIAPYSTGTVTVTIGGQTVGGAGTAWTSDMVGAAIKFDDSPDYVYTISAVNSATQLMLEQPLIADANILAGDYTIAQDSYKLPDDFDRPIDEWKSFFGGNELAPLDDYEFADIRRADRTLNTGEPRHFTIGTQKDNDTDLFVVLNPYPSQLRMFSFRYMRDHPKIEQDGDLVLYPERQVDAIVQSMIDVVNRDFEDDERMARTLQDSLLANSKALKSQPLTERPFMIIPTRRQKAAERAKWYYKGRRFSYGDRFDIVGFRTRG